MTTTEIAKTDSHGRLPSKLAKLPMRGRKSKRQAPVAKLHGQIVAQSLAENVLTAVCFDTEACGEIIHTIDSSMFESAIYREIADKAIQGVKGTGR